jgi:hypothetical protein
MRASTRLPLAMLAVLLAVAGCRREPVPLPGIAKGDGRVEWRGITPCADCDAIAVRLVLRRERGEQRYLLEETYFTGDAGERFVDRGRWRHETGLLRLEGADGSRRTFALGEDGRLRARDSRGRALAVQDDAALSPLPP